MALLPSSLRTVNKARKTVRETNVRPWCCANPRSSSKSKQWESLMKRMHVHVAVDDLKQSIGFYSALFAAQPAVTKDDYAKWMLDDPRVNFAISTRSRQPGLDHLGIQVESSEEFKEIYARPHKAGGNIVEQAAKQLAATPSRRSRGLTIPLASRGRRSLRVAKASTMETAQASASRASRIQTAHETSCCAPAPH